MSQEKYTQKSSSCYYRSAAISCFTLSSRSEYTTLIISISQRRRRDDGADSDSIPN
jgi:hypothetical protein